MRYCAMIFNKPECLSLKGRGKGERRARTHDHGVGNQPITAWEVPRVYLTSIFKNKNQVIYVNPLGTNLGIKLLINTFFWFKSRALDY